MIRDITREKECDAALETMRQQLRDGEQLCTIGTLAAGLGHDVKNLLFPVRCRLDALSAQQIAPAAREDVEMVRQAIKYLQQLAANLQMLAERQGATAATFPGHSVTHLPSWWEHISPLLMASVRKQITITSNLEQNVPPVAAPPHLLTQAIVNLVNNAGKAIVNEGHILIWADSAVQDAPKEGAQQRGFIRIGVTDNGPGMNSEERQRILAQKTVVPGHAHGLSTGLGFPLVRSIAEQVGGTLSIDSTPGRGTTVTLTIPAAAEDPELTDASKFPDGSFAAVSLSDTHIASSMCTLLNLSRLPAVRTSPDEPGPCALWVTEPDLVSPARAKAFLESAPVRRLVMIGSQEATGDHWRDIPAVWIQRPASPRTIREAISEIVHEVLHG